MIWYVYLFSSKDFEQYKDLNWNCVRRSSFLNKSMKLKIANDGVLADKKL